MAISSLVAIPESILTTSEEYLAWEALQEDRYEYWDNERHMDRSTDRIVEIAG